MTVLPCHIPAPKAFERISNGVSAPSANQTSHYQYPDPHQSTMLGLSLIWAQSVLELSSVITGEHGASNLNRCSMTKKTSAGLKPLATNYLQNHSLMLLHNQHISSSMVITRLLLKDCGTGKAETLKSITSLNVFTYSLKNMKTDIPSTQYTSKTDSTLQTDHPGEFTLQLHMLLLPPIPLLLSLK